MRESVYILIVVLCVGSLVYSEKSTYTLSKPGADVELKCSLDPPVHWIKDGKNVTNGLHYSVSAENGTLNIKKLLTGDLAGVYTCNSISGASEQITVFAGPVAKKFAERSITLTEGEKLELKCGAWGHPAPTIRWTRSDGGNLDPVSDSRVKLEDFDGLQNASLSLDGVSLSDYGSYTCIAENKYSHSNNTFNTVTILVRVKGKLTPLWPFIGIILEIIILITIIIVYEKRKSKQTDSDDVKDSGPVVNSNDHRDGENVRARK